MAEDKESQFKISDRRKFNADGSLRDDVETPTSQPTPASSENEVRSGDAHPETSSNPHPNVVSFPGENVRRKEEPQPAQAAPAPATSQKSADSEAAEQAYSTSNTGRKSALPEASFFSLVNILAVEAAMHLGLMEGPEGRTPVDLDAARHMIDMLGLVEEKTRGNLTPQEDTLLEKVLADLRIQYVATSKGR
jgi:hypothetical protein